MNAERIASRVVVAYVCCLFVSDACAQAYLRNLTTKLIYGPIDERSSHQIVIPYGTYMCVSPSENEIAVTRILHNTIVEHMYFESTNVMAVLSHCTNFLAGPNSLTLCLNTNNYTYQPGISKLCAIGAETEHTVPPVSFIGSTMTLFEVLEGICETTYLPVSISNRCITLGQEGHVVVIPGFRMGGGVAESGDSTIGASNSPPSAANGVGSSQLTE